MTEQEFLETIAAALEVDISRLSMQTNTDNLEEWDSLGHLTILMALDQATGGTIGGKSGLAEINNFEKLLELVNEK